MTTSSTPRRGLALAGRHAKLALLIRPLINLAAPALVYLLLRPHLHSDITALVIGAAIPTAYTVVVLLWRRRLDPVGVFALACFAIGLILAVATDGNELVFKLREDLWTGPLGLIFLISTAAGHPLFFTLLQLATRRCTEIAERLRHPNAHRICAVTTWVIGVILLVHALVMVALALTTSTATFLAIQRPISLTIIAGGLVPLVVWIRRQRPNTSVPDRHGNPGVR
jgi:hypothetical protein